MNGATPLKVFAATDPGSATKPNEDAYVFGPEHAVVVDGATSRTASGCDHGTAWYAQTLAAHLAKAAQDTATLRGALAEAIDATAAAHPECDLTHPGSPSATVAAARRIGDALEWLVLGDTVLVIDGPGGPVSHSQPVDHIGRAERDAATALPIGHPDRAELLVAMKHVMQRWRNVECGYWVASHDRSVATRAATGTVPAAEVRRLLLLTDGAAVLHDLYQAASITGMLNLAQTRGPEAIIHQVRVLEAADPDAVRYRRTKRCDDATAVFIAAQ